MLADFQVAAIAPNVDGPSFGESNSEDFVDAEPIKPCSYLDQHWAQQFPLYTRGRHVMDQRGERFRLCGVNWYGASDANHVVGGLDVQRLEVICETVSSLGFNVVRLPFSNEMLRSQVPPAAIDFELNPGLRGLSALEVLDEVVQCLGRHRVAVILNNHTTYGEWCGPPSKNSLWFDPGTEYTPERWLEDWLMLARRYACCPHVVGYDLRNEIRPILFHWPVWRGRGCRLPGTGHDWALAATAAAVRLLSVCPRALVVVERIVWPQAGLWDYAACPGPLLPELQGHLVLGVHHYAWSGPGRFLPRWSVPTRMGWADSLLRTAGLVSPLNYGDMGPEELAKQVRQEWGCVLEADLCPVWVSEFGADAGNADEMQWLKAFTQTLADSDADWAYWPLNVGPKPSCGSDEAYGILAPDWRPKDAGDKRLELLKQIGLASKTPPSVPGLSAPIPESHMRTSQQLLKPTNDRADGAGASLSWRPASLPAATSAPIVAASVAAADDVAAPAPVLLGLRVDRTVMRAAAWMLAKLM